MSNETWPALPLADWKPTYETVQLWTQIAGKIRMATTPLVNHWWNTTLYVTGRGLTTAMMPYGDGGFELRFDFVDHVLVIESSWARPKRIELRPQPTADFYAAVMSTLDDLGIDVKIWPVSVETPTAIPLDTDREHASYDKDAVNRWWRAMVSIDEIFQEFRSRFIGKSSPVHFFWGAFDLAVTRFSGRRAPKRPPEPLAKVMAEAYSHEVWSGGFWPGGNGVDASFYAYAAPQPEGFDRATVKPAAANYDTTFKEFLLPYDAVRTSNDPRASVLDFLQTTYEAAANLAHWDRASLER